VLARLDAVCAIVASTERKSERERPTRPRHNSRQTGNRTKKRKECLFLASGHTVRRRPLLAGRQRPRARTVPKSPVFCLPFVVAFSLSLPRHPSFFPSPFSSRPSLYSFIQYSHTRTHAAHSTINLSPDRNRGLGCPGCAASARLCPCSTRSRYRDLLYNRMCQRRYTPRSLRRRRHQRLTAA